MIGGSLDRFARSVVREETYAAIIAPAIADLQFEARLGRSTRIRAYAGVWRALCAAFAGELARDAATLLRRGPVGSAIEAALLTLIVLTVAMMLPLLILRPGWNAANAPWHHTAVLVPLMVPMFVGSVIPAALVPPATILGSWAAPGAKRAAVLLAVALGLLLLLATSVVRTTADDLRRDFTFASAFARKDPELYRRPLWELRSAFRNRLDALAQQDRATRQGLPPPDEIAPTVLTFLACGLAGASWARRRLWQVITAVVGVLAFQILSGLALSFSVPIYGGVVVRWCHAILLFLMSCLLALRSSEPNLEPEPRTANPEPRTPNLEHEPRT